MLSGPPAIVDYGRLLPAPTGRSCLQTISGMGGSSGAVVVVGDVRGPFPCFLLLFLFDHTHTRHTHTHTLANTHAPQAGNTHTPAFLISFYFLQTLLRSRRHGQASQILFKLIIFEFFLLWNRLNEKYKGCERGWKRDRTIWKTFGSSWRELVS